MHLRQAELSDALRRVAALVERETDAVALMATIACELYHGVPTYDWVGFYRLVEPRLLKIGPYQGTHGCLQIPLERGICGRCAATGAVQNIPDVHADPAHLACSATTQSELVLPVRDATGRVAAVLDVDSNAPANFTATDESLLSQMLRVFANAAVRW